MTSNDIEEISKLLGEDMLSMEEKISFKYCKGIK